MERSISTRKNNQRGQTMIDIKKYTDFHTIHIRFHDFEVELLNYGASLKQVRTPDIYGEMADVLLEYQNLEDYLNNDIYLNANVGPICGRIKDGIVPTPDKQYQLLRNQHNLHTLHSADQTFAFVFFDYHIHEKDQTYIIHFYKDLTLLNEFNYRVDIIYTIKKHDINIAYQIKTNKAFVFNVTNHAYFNLSGNLKTPIDHHYVRLASSLRYELDQEQIPQANLLDEETYDFTNEKPIGQGLMTLKNHPFGGYDDLFFFPNHKKDQSMAIVYDGISKRQLKVYTSYDHMQFYSHNIVSNVPLKHLNNHIKHYGLCLECQKGPIGSNQSQSDDLILKPNQTFDAYIRFSFSIKK